MSTIRRLPFHLIVLASLGIGVALAHAAQNRRVVHKTPPVYPELARRMHLSGTVVLEVTVLPDGSVAQMRTESGHAMLAEAAQEAVRRWRFEPAPETSNTTVNVNFGEQQ